MNSVFKDIYDLRQNFTVIGLTGRTGSGCSKFADLLSKQDLNEINKYSYFRKPVDFKTIKELKPDFNINDNFQRKYEIVHNYVTRKSWKSYKTISYRDVILLLTLTCFADDSSNLNMLIEEHYYDKKDNVDQKLIDTINTKINNLYLQNKKGIELLKELNSVLFSNDDLSVNLRQQLKNTFFYNTGKIKDIINEFDSILKENYAARTIFLHRVACDLREYNNLKDRRETKPNTKEGIYFIISFINTLIKISRKNDNDEKEPCHIVIDSLRNSLEIMFLKERYSAFYMVSVKGLRRKSRIINRINNGTVKSKIKLANRLLELDETEYKTRDFDKGKLYAPDVQNCIAQSDIHIFNSDESDLISNINSEDERFLMYHQNYFDGDKNSISNELGRGFNSFFSLSEQAIKLQALIQQPGIIGPSHIEHCMQLAYSSRLNSGCISRQVGAVVTDNRYSVKAIGWNEAASGATPCKYRDVTKLANYNETSNDQDFKEFSDFEKGIAREEYDNEENHKIESEESIKFNNFLKSSYSNIKNSGKPCSFCFKKTYNEFKGDENQVHTRSLHAEENAMLQISKYGGQSLKGGYLFTTASPCELCAKKAYQIGISSIFYIDPYPGISKSHILKSNPKKDPEMVFFVGAIGRGYHQLYEPFIAYKDEMLTENKIKFKRDGDDFKKDIIDKFKGQFSLEDDDKVKDEIDKIMNKFKQ